MCCATGSTRAAVPCFAMILTISRSEMIPRMWCASSATTTAPIRFLARTVIVSFNDLAGSTLLTFRPFSFRIPATLINVLLAGAFNVFVVRLQTRRHYPFRRVRGDRACAQFHLRPVFCLDALGHRPTLTDRLLAHNALHPVAPPKASTFLLLSARLAPHPARSCF